jgi:hypothetical protein
MEGLHFISPIKNGVIFNLIIHYTYLNLCIVALGNNFFLYHASNTGHRVAQ